MTNDWLKITLFVFVWWFFAIRTTSAGTFACTVTVDGSTSIGEISPYIYGQYLEHVEAHERTIYPSLWDDKSSQSNEMGIRVDVTSAVKKLGTPIVRWPGGCFADVYHWEDAIGPRDARQPKKNLHWGGMESNMFGTDEFLHWCDLADVEPYINVNLGSGSLDEALRWLEYCNGAALTTQGARRAANGTTVPYNVKYWGIGNETWGEWETGHTDADTYGTSLSLWARAMHDQDPSIKILGVGSEEGNDTKWDSTVLERAGTDIDLLTVHMYGITTTYDGSEYEAFVFTPDYLETRLKKVIATVDQSPASALRDVPIDISVDEWNIRHFYDGKQNRQSPRTMQDAIFAAGFFNAMIRQSPRVSMANYVFLVNGNATLLVDGDQIVWTPLAHAFQQYTKWMHGTALSVNVDGPKTMPPPPLTAHPGRKPAGDYKPEAVNWVSATAAFNGDNELKIALVNRHQENSAEVQLNLRMPQDYGIRESWTLAADDIYEKNTFSNPEAVKPTLTKVMSGTKPAVTHWTCPPHSITLLNCEKY